MKIALAIMWLLGIPAAIVAYNLTHIAPPTITFAAPRGPEEVGLCVGCGNAVSALVNIPGDAWMIEGLTVDADTRKVWCRKDEPSKGQPIMNRSEPGAVIAFYDLHREINAAP